MKISKSFVTKFTVGVCWGVGVLFICIEVSRNLNVLQTLIGVPLLFLILIGSVFSSIAAIRATGYAINIFLFYVCGASLLATFSGMYFAEVIPYGIVGDITTIILFFFFIVVLFINIKFIMREVSQMREFFLGGESLAHRLLNLAKRLKS